MVFSRLLSLGLVLLSLVCLPFTEAGVFDKVKKQKEEEKKAFGGKDAAEMGLEGLKNSLGDPNLLREAMELSKDPKFMAEVKAMMEDPDFKAEMDAMMNSELMQKSLKAAGEIAKDPVKMAQFEKGLQGIIGGGQKEHTGKDNAQLGLANLAKTARDPMALKEAFEMLKDPEIMKEVDAMMKDPEFQAEMKRMSNDPAFKSAMSQAAMNADDVMADPKKLKRFQKEYEGVFDSLKEL